MPPWEQTRPPGADTPLGANTPPPKQTPLTGADTPPERRPLLMTVHILLECILVSWVYPPLDPLLPTTDIVFRSKQSIMETLN